MTPELYLNDTVEYDYSKVKYLSQDKDVIEIDTNKLTNDLQSAGYTEIEINIILYALHNNKKAYHNML